MSTIADAIQDKCLAFGDRVIKLNDFLLEQAANKHQPSSVKHHPSAIRHLFDCTGGCQAMQFDTASQNNNKPN